METMEDTENISLSMTDGDPILGSLWYEEALDIECLNLGRTSPLNESHEEDQQSQTVHSPSHGLDQLLDLQLDLPSQLYTLPDWGELDDLMHQAQTSEDQTPIPGNSTTLDNETDRITRMSQPDLRRDSPLSASTFGQGANLSSSIPTSFDAFPSWNDFAPPSSGMMLANHSPARSNDGSIASGQSDRRRGRPTKKRKPGLQSQQEETSPFREVVFDSNHMRSSSRASSSSRRQPLHDDALQMMRAVKAVGACWRCKVFRKPCKPETPCEPCQVTYNTQWQRIGCKRGALKDEIDPIILCPKSNLHREVNAAVIHTALVSIRHQEQTSPSIGYPQNTIGNHTRDFPVTASFLSSWDTSLAAMLTGLNVENSLMNELRVSTDLLPKDCRVVVPILKPLESSVLVIVWELFQYPSSLRIISPWTSLHSGSIGGFIRLLRSAAIYEADLDNESARVSASHEPLQSSTDTI